MRYAPTAAPRPHRRVVQSPLADSLALFHLDTRRLHVLNGSAAAIWEELHGVDTVGELTIRLGDRFGVEPRSIRQDVEVTIDQLRSDGLLQIDDQFAVATSSPRETPVPELDGDEPVYAALDARVAIRCTDTEVAHAIDRILAPLHVDQTPTVLIDVRRESDDLWTLVVGDGDAVTMGSQLSLVLRVVGEINNLAVASVPDHLVLHAGAVAVDDAAVVMPAASNHGKSTLTTALVRSGFDYLTDEAAAIGADAHVRPFAKAIALDPGSFPLFEDLAPADDLGGLARAITCREWHVDPVRLGTVAGPTPVRAIVCPHWRAGAGTRVTRLDRCEALHLLLGESFDFTLGGQAVFDRLVRLVDDVPVFRLGYSDTDEAIAEVRSILERDGGV